MNPPRKIVLDTNILVSAALRNGSVPHLALLKARAESWLLACDETVSEFREVLLGKKFDGAVDRGLREEVVQEYERLCILIPIPTPIRACRDPKDDMVFECAILAGASLIVAGDKDLLAVEIYEGIRVLTPRDFLRQLESPAP